MCQCTPGIKTPFCGISGCTWEEYEYNKTHPKFDTKMKLREMQATGKCRCCEKTLARGTEVFYTYLSTSRGGKLFICKQCVAAMNSMNDFKGE